MMGLLASCCKPAQLEQHAEHVPVLVGVIAVAFVQTVLMHSKDSCRHAVQSDARQNCPFVHH